jgi:hypothetical protein
LHNNRGQVQYKGQGASFAGINAAAASRLITSFLSPNAMQEAAVKEGLLLMKYE